MSDIGFSDNLAEQNRQWDRVFGSPEKQAYDRGYKAGRATGWDEGYELGKQSDSDAHAPNPYGDVSGPQE